MDGSTDQRERSVMNFFVAGEQGTVATVSMDGKKKTGPALARLWEKIMREIGLQRINAICTDNVEVNKKGAQILEWRTDLAVSRIPWVPCAAHCCSLLLWDISKLDWIKGTIKRSHTIVKFIRNHHCTHSLMMSLDDSLSMTRPTEVRFGSVYIMMERLYDRRAVLKQMVEGSMVGRWKAMRWSTIKLQSKADLVFFTLQRESWWPELKKVVEAMDPLYNLLRRMDKDGIGPSNLVEYDKLMERMLGEVLLTTEQRDTVLEKSILIKVMGMWSTATPAERNWYSMDLVHSKRRNRLNPSTLEKLVYIHWNIQLLRSGKNVKDNGYIDLWEQFFESLPEMKDNGYIDLWAQFFESLPESVADDGSTLNEPVEEQDKTEEELVRERAFTKTPKGRILKCLEHEDEEEERTDDCDLDNEVWKGRLYGRRPAQRRRERPPTTPSQCPANTATHYNIQSDVHLPQTDTDMEMVLRARPIDTDEEDADRAKAWADADRERVQRRMREEEERRAAITTRRELEKMKKRVGERESQPVGVAGRLEEDKEDALGQREEEAEQEIGQPAQEEENMDTQEEEEDDGMDQREEEMNEGDGEGVEQQEEDLEESGKEQQQE
ncbi:hypothetical protein CBR_g50165 [Chara braunii]|uniref:DUF659 domain-containing protein n=1 Tax=Chara braunii TaxID=69332 RepID=A0A388M6H5_CHABU|nr:hypothetical protein CBR_g50165 [Chara braunii]|eukprot:GBG90072.1 hypothetical protein CBR_g50165 [Chara braunii]